MNENFDFEGVDVPAQILIVVVVKLRLYEAAPKTGPLSRTIENSGKGREQQEPGITELP